MEPVRIPRHTTLSEEGGYWILRWSGDLFDLCGIRHPDSGNQARIGSASGANALSEGDALRISRRYLLSRLSPAAQANRALMTIAEFVETRFLPEFVATKTLAGRAHYHSILKLVLSPEEPGRACGVRIENAVSEIASRPGWPHLGNMRFRDVRSEDVQQLIEAALKKGYSTQTVRHIRSVISAVFAYAKQELAFMGNNLAASTTVPEMVRKTTPNLTLADVEQMLRAMHYPEKEMTLIALLTDMNVSEICGLQWKYVNLTGASSNPHGEFIPPITIAVHKRWYRGELANVKDTRRRNLPISEVLLPVLLLLSGRAKFTGPDDFVLTSRSGKALNVANITARRLGSIGRNLGITTLTWQVLRRAQAAIKADHGQDFQYRIAAAAAWDGQQDRTIAGRNSKPKEPHPTPDYALHKKPQLNAVQQWADLTSAI
jgi:integrase